MAHRSQARGWGGRRQVFRKIAGALQCIRNDCVEVLRGYLPQTAVAAEEEYLVPHDRAADRRAETVDVFWRPCCLKITVGIEVRLLMKFEDRTVHLVCAGLRQNGYNTSARATILRAEVIRLNIELIDGIRVRNDIAGSTNARSC